MLSQPPLAPSIIPASTDNGQSFGIAHFHCVYNGHQERGGHPISGSYEVVEGRNGLYSRLVHCRMALLPAARCTQLASLTRCNLPRWRSPADFAGCLENRCPPRNGSDDILVFLACPGRLLSCFSTWPTVPFSLGAKSPFSSSNSYPPRLQPSNVPDQTKRRRPEGCAMTTGMLSSSPLAATPRYLSKSSRSPAMPYLT